MNETTTSKTDDNQGSDQPEYNPSDHIGHDVHLENLTGTVFVICDDCDMPAGKVG